MTDHANGPDLDRLPVPVALPCQLVEDFLHRGQVAAAWLTLRDAFESITRFVVGIALADYLASPRLREEQLEVLLTSLVDKAPSMGDWLRVGQKILAKHKVPGQLFDPAGSGLVVPQLYRFACLPSTKRSDSPSGPWQRLTEIVQWRNDRIGHGALGMDLVACETDVLQKRQWLRTIVEHLIFLREYRLSSAPLDGRTEIDWTGASVPRIAGLGPNELVQVQLTPRAGGRSLTLGPILSITSHVDGVVGLFFFDKLGGVRERRRGDWLLDYARGRKHLVTPYHRDVEQLLARIAVANRVELDRTASSRVLDRAPSTYDERMQAALRKAQFGGDLKHRFLKPTHLITKLRQQLGAHDACYVVLLGPEGTGKSWLAGSLDDSDVLGHLAQRVLHYRIGIGSRQSPQLMASEIDDAARQRHGCGTLGLLYETPTSDRPARHLMTEFLTRVARDGRHGGVILVIDGIDELGDPGPEVRTIADYLPLPSSLPAGCQVVVCMRGWEEVPARHRDVLLQLRTDGVTDDRWCELNIDPSAPEMHDLLRRYIAKPQIGLDEIHAKRADLIEEILRASGGVFLRVAYLCALVNVGDPLREPLPDRLADLTRRYLDLLRNRIGPPLFDELHARLLVAIAIARAPVTLPVISDLLGVPLERLLFASFDLVPFLRSHRTDAGWPRLEIAHAELRHVLAHSPVAIDTHRTVVGQLAIRTAAGWPVSGHDAVDIYACEHVVHHLLALGSLEEAAMIVEDIEHVVSRLSTRSGTSLPSLLEDLTAMLHSPAADRVTRLAAFVRRHQHLLARGGVDALFQLIEREPEGSEILRRFRTWQARGRWPHPTLQVIWHREADQSEARIATIQAATIAGTMSDGRVLVRCEGELRAVFADGSSQFLGAVVGDSSGARVPDTSTRLVMYRDREVFVVELATGAIVRTVEIATHEIQSCAVNRGATVAYVGTVDEVEETGEYTTLKSFGLRRIDLLTGVVTSLASLAQVDPMTLVVREQLVIRGHRSLEIRDAATGQVTRSIACEDVCDLVADSTGSRIAICDAGRIRVVDTATWEEICALPGTSTPQGRFRPIKDGAAPIAFHPDGHTLVFGAPGRAEVWDLDRRVLVGVLRGHNDVVDIAVTCDGRYAVTEDAWRSVRIWDLTRMTVEETSHRLDCVAIRSDGTRAWAASADHVSTWDLRSGAQANHVIGDDHGSLVAIDGERGTLILWHAPSTFTIVDGETKRMRRTTAVLPTKFANPVGLHPDGKHLLIRGWHETCLSFPRRAGVPPVWKPGSGKLLLSCDLDSGVCVSLLDPPSGELNRVAIDRSGRWALSTREVAASGPIREYWLSERLLSRSGPPNDNDDDCVAHLWDLVSGTHVLTVRDPSRGDWILHASDRAFFEDEDGVHLVELTTGKTLGLLGHSHVRRFVVSADGGTVLIGGSDCTVGVWDVASRACVGTLFLENVPRSLAISNDRTFIVADLGGNVVIGRVVSACR